MSLTVCFAFVVGFFEVALNTSKPEKQQSLLIITFQHPKSPNIYKAKRNYSQQKQLC